MSFLQSWVRTPLAEALGWTLIHSLWEGAIIASILGATLLIIRSSQARYVAACGALLLMLGGLGFTLVRVMPEHNHGKALKKPVFLRWDVGTSSDDQGSSSQKLSALVPWLGPFWIAGVWIFFIKQLGGWTTVCRLRRRGVCCAPESWQSKLMDLSDQLRLSSRPILLLESCLADVPMVLGHLRPVILMPVGLLAGLPAGQIEAVLLHELAHVRRCDYLVNTLQRMVEGLLFYHPAAWWISRVIRAERENCCDDLVVATSGNAHEYAVALAALEQNRELGHAAATAATGGNLMKRIRRLLYPRESNSVWTALFAALILIIATTAVLAAWPSGQVQPSSSPTTQLQIDEVQLLVAMETAADQFLKKWLDQDVVYIISDDEAAAFKRLTTDEEKHHFIEQFWSRRDPSPDTVENEFRDEHYRRIEDAQ